MAIQDLKASLDLKQNLNIYTTCKQFDNLNLILSIFDNSLQTDLTNYDIRLRAMKADNVPLIQQHIGITKSGNVVNIQADAQLTTTAGNTPIELQFIDKSTGEKKATFNLVLVVVASAIAIEASISKATYTLLEELEKKLDQASDFFEHIGEAIEANTNLINSTNTANETKEALDDSNTTALATKESLDASNTSATNTKNALDTLKTSADNTKNALNTVNQTGQSLLNSLEEFEQEHADVTNISNQLANVNAQLSENTQQLKDIVVNVKSFSAKGDGVTDDTKPFQDAVNYIFSINPLGGKLLIPQGKYLISTPINTYTNKNYDFEGNEISDTSIEKKNGPIPMITFEGSGINNTILKSANGNEIIKGYSLTPSAIYDLTIRNLRFLGYNNQGTSLNMNSANGTIKNVLIENVSFNNFDKGIVYTRDDTVTWGEQSRLILRNCKAGNNKIGFEISGDDTDLINCRSEYNLAWGLVVKGGTRLNINKCKIQYNGNDDGINNAQVKFVGSIKSLTVDKCYFEPANVASITTKSAFFYVCTDENINAGSTYLYNFSIKDSFFNGKQIQKLIICENNPSIYIKGLDIINNRIQFFTLVDNILIEIPNSISPKGIQVTGTFENIKDSSGNDISSTFIVSNNPNIINNNGYCFDSIITSPVINTKGGALQLIGGSVNSTATQLYFGSGWFTVVKNGTGDYTINLIKTNLGTLSGNATIIPAVVTPVYEEGNPLTANIVSVSATSFTVKIFTKEGTPWNKAFNFLVMLSCI